MCKDFAYCSTYEINQYNDTVDTAAGGPIADGVYRTAWEVNPASAGQQEGFGAYAEAYRFQNGSYVNTGTGGRGTFTTTGTTLTLTKTNNCNLGAEGDVENPPYTRTVTYSALSDRIVFYEQSSSGSMTWTAMHVYLKVNDACQTVDAAPTSAGDSYRCTVVNCACNESTNGTVQLCD
jgi:hypothetical protein